MPAYVEALCREIEMIGSESDPDEEIHSLFFGGGTPSLLKAQQVNQIISASRQSFRVCQDAEITLEANPGTVTLNRIQQYAASGVNRFSFGMQSAHPDDLRILDRLHTFEDVVAAVKACKIAGIRHINLDLIFGIPGQSLERWKTTLQRATDMGVDHLSVYGLTIEEETPMARWIQKGLLEPPDDDLAADMYELAEEFLESQGFDQYEISNWSRGEAAQCRHNLQYWHYGHYYGFGAGAHGFINGTRTENVSLIPEYLTRMREKLPQSYPASPAIKEANQLSWWDQAQESMMVGLRLTASGVTAAGFKKKFGVGFDELFAVQIKRLINEGLLEIINVPERSLRLTRKGRLLGNQVFLEFVGNEPPRNISSASH